jgi:LysM repeat protein
MEPAPPEIPFMTQAKTVPCHRPRVVMAATALTLGLAALAASTGAAAAGPDFPITAQQRSTAQQVAQAGVPLSELAPNAPDSYTVKSGDTLWGISSLFLKSPWKWPELWGMNLEQIRNPHLIYPGQQLVLEKSGDRARLKVAGGGAPTGNDRLSPRVRDAGIGGGPLASVPIKYIESFFNEAVILDSNELESAPRIVASQEGRVLLGKGDRAYVRGETGATRDWRVFRRARALTDPDTGRVIGWEARFVGAPTTRARSSRPPSASPQRARRPTCLTAWRRPRRRTSRPWCRMRRRSRSRVASCLSTAMRSTPARTRSWHSTAAPATGWSAAMCSACGAPGRWPVTRPRAARCRRSACPTSDTASCSCFAPSRTCPTR